MKTIEKLSYYCSLIGISYTQDLETINQEIDKRVKYFQEIIKRSDEKTKKRLQNDIKRLLEIRKEVITIFTKQSSYVTSPGASTLTFEKRQIRIGNEIHEQDAMGRVIRVVFQEGFSIKYSYDPVGNRTRMVYPNGEVVTYKYNANNWLTEVVTKSGKTLFEYDKRGNLTKKILPNGIIITYTYNGAGKLVGLVINDVSGHLLFSFSYTLDGVGNYLKIDNSNNITFFAYDPLYRLTKINYPDGREVKYKYDPIGNRLSMRTSPKIGNSKLKQWLTKPAINLGILGNRIRYIYDSEGRLIKAGDIEFKYDSNGNLIERNSSNGTTRYTYDVDNRLIKIEYPDGTYSKYTYDTLGRRISKRSRDGRITYYLYDGCNFIQELDDKGRVISSYIYDMGIDRPLSMTRNGKTYYYLFDHLGSVIALSDEKGEIVAEYEYDAWGNITKEVGDIENPFRFTGREWDEESGLYYYRERYYDPSVGRFISRDPITDNPVNPQNLNRYVYVNNNPQTYVDPYGLLPMDNLLGFMGDVLTGLLKGGYFTPNQILGPGGQYLFNFAGKVKAANIGGILSNIGPFVRLSEFIPHLLNPNHLQALTSAVPTATSIVGSMYGAGVGTALGAGVSLGTALMTGGAIAGMSIGLPAVIVGAVGAVVGGWAFRHLGRFITHTIETGGQNILNAVQSHVGGVLFDRAAEVLTELEEITGAYWDDNLGQLVLVGKKNGKIEQQYLPRMDKDHLAVAMRAIFSGDNLGVSIDPPHSCLESGEFPPDGTNMLVRYLGNTKDTLFGAIMFEADRLLKNLSMGTDNETRKEVTSQVADFQNELDLSLKYGTEKKIAWHRMWFVIEDMKLEMPVKETPDRNALSFTKATLKVKAEYLSKDKNPGVDPIAERFAKHFTLHFDDFAKEYPVLERLRELAKIAAIAKYLKNSGKPVDLSFLNDYDFIKVDTPKDTPGITVSKSKSWQSGNTTHTQTYSVYGGVDFDFRYRAIKDDGEAFAIRKIAQENKPCETALAWDFKYKGETYRALALPIAKTSGNYSTTHIDFSLCSTDGIGLELARCYDSFNTRPTIFGYGWNFRVLYKLFIINPDKSNSPILLIDEVRGKSYKYNYIEDKQSYFLVKEEKEENGGTSFTYDPQKFIKRNPDSSFTYKSEDGNICNFDSRGRLIEVKKRGLKINYVYQNTRLVEISDSFGHSIRLIYDHKNRVKQAICPDEIIINYLYDCYGDLIKIWDNKGNVKRYIYDADHRLIKAKNAEGRVILKNSYDPLGRVVRKRQDVVTDAKGNLITRIYDDNYQLIKEEDKQGNSVSYEYDKFQNLIKTVISDRLNRKTVIEYDEEERIKKITNPLGYSIKIAYDSHGNITSIIDPNGHIQHFEYDDDNGNLILFQDSMGNQWIQRFDEASHLINITDPMGWSINLTYEGDKLIAVKTPQGVTHYKYDEKGRLVKITDANGNSTEFDYDFRGRLSQVKDALGNITRYEYDRSGNLMSIRDAKGNTHHYTPSQNWQGVGAVGRKSIPF